MDILQEIKNLLGCLDSKTPSVDFDNVRHVLAEAYTLVRQGLELSNDASKYRQLKKDFDELQQNHTVLKDQLAEASSRIPPLEEQLAALTPVVDALKRDLRAKVSLIERYAPLRKIALIQKIDNGPLAELPSLKTDIESDFNAAWLQNGKKFSAQQLPSDLTPFKIGAH